ncbi:MAG: hypothetical protein ABFD52_12305 [Acidobacteriota bacterium]
MGKTIVVLVLIAAAGYFVYQRLERTPSDEEQLVAHLRERYAVVVNEFASAAGRSGLIGIDSTADADTAVNAMKKLRAELEALRAKLTEERASRKADELLEKIENFYRKNDIIRP